MKPFLLLLSFLFVHSMQVFAGGGMWLPHLIKVLNEDEMHMMGMKMSADDIYSVNESSLKDAVVHFGGFCTGEVISDQGLILTNHHCGYRQIQSHSSVENNYLEKGFWAANFSEELPNPGLFVRFIDRIVDATDEILAGLDPQFSAAERQSQIDKNIEAYRQHMELDEFHEVALRPLFKGNQYIAIVTIDYPDVRLVGAPPESIGKYGHDTDNWVWPRHTGDFALFRAYTDAQGQPAEYDENNRPMTPRYALPISMDGVEEGDFTLVFGFPGRTDEYLPSFAVDQVAHVINPVRISTREAVMEIWDKAMKSDQNLKIKYAAKYASLTNYWKKWKGESNGIKRSKAVEKKESFEAAFQQKLNQSPDLHSKYNHLLPELKRVYHEMADLEVAQALQSEIFGRNIDVIVYDNAVHRLLLTYENQGMEAYQRQLPRYQGYLEGQYKNWDAQTDLQTMVQLMQNYQNVMPEGLLSAELKSKLNMAHADEFNSSIYFDPDRLIASLADPESLRQKLSTDPIHLLNHEVKSHYQEKVGDPIAALEEKRNELMRHYMQAQMDAFPEKTFFPDANSTLRVTYGQVAGYEPRDGVYYLPTTDLDGVIEKYVEGDWEFDLPQRLLDLHQKKDYGPYEVDGSVPVNFIGSNHTTGGNSGSPALDAYGNLIGLNFDRVWEGTMSDLNYDPSICRNIMVDVRYILFVIDKYAGAQNIIDELKLVHPKQANREIDRSE